MAEQICWLYNWRERGLKMERIPLFIGVFVSILLFVFGIAIKYYKAYWLISGYNTMSVERKKNVDIKNLGNFLAKVFIYPIWYYINGFSNYKPETRFSFHNCILPHCTSFYICSYQGANIRWIYERSGWRHKNRNESIEQSNGWSFCINHGWIGAFVYAGYKPVSSIWNIHMSLFLWLAYP